MCGVRKLASPTQDLLTTVGQLLASKPLLDRYLAAAYERWLGRPPQYPELKKGRKAARSGGLLSIDQELAASSEYYRRADSDSTYCSGVESRLLTEAKVDPVDNKSGMSSIAARRLFVQEIMSSAEFSKALEGRFTDLYQSPTSERIAAGRSRQSHSGLSLENLLTDALHLGPPIIWVEHPYILTTDNLNPDTQTSYVYWARDLASDDGTVFLENDRSDHRPVWEWTPATSKGDVYLRNNYESDAYCASGFAVAPDISDRDLPFTHPFATAPGSGRRGFDWEFGLAVDNQFVNLLAPTNCDLSGCAPQLGLGNAEHDKRLILARMDRGKQDPSTGLAGLGLDGQAGILGVETDQALVPEPYRARHGDRTVVYGRWIIDAGHNDFSCEIHPPLLLVTARSSDNGETAECTIIGRPYLVDQDFSDYDHDLGGPFGPTVRRSRALRGELDQQLEEIAGVAGSCGSVGLPVLPCRDSITISPRLLAPFHGDANVLHFTLRPANPAQSTKDRLLVSGGVTVRNGVVVIFDAGHSGRPGNEFLTDQLEVYVALVASDYLKAMPPLPKPMFRDTVTVEDLLSGLPPDQQQQVLTTLQGKIDELSQSGYPYNAHHLAAAIRKGADLHYYDAPRAASPMDGSKNYTNVPVDTLGIFHGRPKDPIVIDNRQPFPIYGRLSVSWQRN
jgi:hypothetical protein